MQINGSVSGAAAGAFRGSAYLRPC